MTRAERPGLHAMATIGRKLNTTCTLTSRRARSGVASGLGLRLEPRSAPPPARLGGLLLPLSNQVPPLAACRAADLVSATRGYSVASGHPKRRSFRRSSCRACRRRNVDAEHRAIPRRRPRLTGGCCTAA